MPASAKSMLVVDANIISHALVANQTQAYAKLFSVLEKSYRFAVSGFTRYELLRSSDKLHREKILTYIQNEMMTVDLSSVLMDFSARVSYMYANHTSTKGYKISDGDVFNASLSIIKSCPVLTIDSLDYPIPFFQEIERKRVQYTSKRNREVIDTVYILKPDMDNVQYCFKEYLI